MAVRQGEAVASSFKYGAILVSGAALWSALSGCTGHLVYRPEKPKVKEKPAVAVSASIARLPRLPDPKLNNSTPAGIDTTGAGVRDDVQIWIYTSYTTAKKRPPLMALARNLQVVVAQPPQKAAEAQKLERSFNDALLALRGVPGLQPGEADEMNSSLYARVYNTPQRLKLYLQYNLLLSEKKKGNGGS
jgi:hypothetical protein